MLTSLTSFHCTRFCLSRQPRDSCRTAITTWSTLQKITYQSVATMVTLSGFTSQAAHHPQESCQRISRRRRKYPRKIVCSWCRPSNPVSCLLCRRPEVHTENSINLHLNSEINSLIRVRRHTSDYRVTLDLPSPSARLSRLARRTLQLRRCSRQ